MAKQEMTLVFDSKAIKQDHGTVARYVREAGGHGADASLFATYTRRLAPALPKLIADGYVRIEPVKQ